MAGANPQPKRPPRLAEVSAPTVRAVSRSQRRTAWRRPSRIWKVVSWGFGALFVTAAAVTLYPFWPAIYYRIATPNISPTQQVARASNQVPAATETNTVIIPKIGVRTAILEGSSLDILNKYDGVWHQTGTFANNFVLAGHRFKYRPPNTSTLYNLDKLQVGDVIVVDWQGKRTVFTITQLTVVPATAIDVIKPTTSPQLTIYTCNEKRETHRVVAVAMPLS